MNNLIYALSDPRDDNIKYIGATSEGIQRYKRHTRIYYLKKSTLKNNWIKSLLSKNLKPNFIILEYCKKDQSDLCNNLKGRKKLKGLQFIYV